MSLRRRVLAAVLIFALTTTLIPAHAGTANVIEVTHSPDVPESGQDVNITMKVDNATNITSVKIIYCSIEPFICQLPANMTKSSSDNNLFTYTITKKYNPRTKIGFKFNITYEDATYQILPKSTADSSLHPVEGPYDKFYYFTFTIKSDSIVDTNFLTWIVIVIIVVAIIPLIAAILLWTKKRKGRKDEGEK